LRSRLAIVSALVLCFGVGGFFATKALDEGAKDERFCTLMGCSSGIAVRLDGLRRATSARLCAGAGCASGRLGRGETSIVRREWRGVPKRAHAILDRHGRVLLHLGRAVELQKFEPNGHACGPTCWFAGLRLDAARRRLVAAQS
jgi:hypothetical protein